MSDWMDCWYRTGFDPYSLSVDFLKRLHRYDNGRIRLRWSADRQKWAVERKSVTSVEVVKGISESVTRYDSSGRMYEAPSESYILARDGYLVIDYIDPQPGPGHWLIHNLEYADIRRWGGSKEFIRKLEAFEEFRAKQKQKQNSERWRYLASESYDTLKRAYGEQAFVPKEYEQVAQS